MTSVSSPNRQPRREICPGVRISPARPASLATPAPPILPVPCEYLAIVPWCTGPSGLLSRFVISPDNAAWPTLRVDALLDVTYYLTSDNVHRLTRSPHSSRLLADAVVPSGKHGDQLTTATGVTGRKAPDMMGTVPHHMNILDVAGSSSLAFECGELPADAGVFAARARTERLFLGGDRPVSDRGCGVAGRA